MIHTVADHTNAQAKPINDLQGLLFSLQHKTERMRCTAQATRGVASTAAVRKKQMAKSTANIISVLVTPLTFFTQIPKTGDTAVGGGVNKGRQRTLGYG